MLPMLNADFGSRSQRCPVSSSFQLSASCQPLRRPLLLSLFVCGALSSLAHADEPQPPVSSTATLMNEIIVTARRREENIKDTPISITAFSGAALEARGIERTEELAHIVPNLVYQENPGAGGSASNAAIFIRGVGQSDFIPTVDQGVGLYVDGVYVASTVGALLDLVDTARVEVLRGPQGTLFGRNTIGGAVSITTDKPAFEFAATSSALFGTDSRTELKGRINVPLSSSVAGSLSVALIKQDGYVDQIHTNQELGDRNHVVGRIALRWKGDNSELNFSADGTRTRENGAAFVLRGVNFQSAIFDPKNLPLLPPGSPPTPGFYTINPPADVPVDNFALFNNYIATLVAGAGNCLGLGSPTYSPSGDQSNPACYGSQFVGEASRTNFGTLPSINRDDLWGTHLTWDWQIADRLRLKSITAYRHLHSDFQRDGDESPLTIYHLIDDLAQQQFSEELQLEGESQSQALKWVGGVYYFDERAQNPNTVDFSPIKVLSGGDSSTKSYAAFAQATYDITASLSLTAGLRYTRDKKTFLPKEFVLDSKGGPFPVGLPVLPPDEVDATFSKSTPLLNAAYHVNPDMMVYATYSKGFKSGGFTQRVFPPLPATPTFQPETVTSYEVGLKTATLEDRVHINAAAYLTNYDDIQVSIFRAIAPITDNGGKGRIKGLEFETQISPGAGWFFEANAGLTDAEYTEIAPTATELSLNSKFALISKWNGLAAVQKEIRLQQGGALSPRIEWTYRSSYYNDALNTAATFQPGYGLLNGLLRWTSASTKYSASAGVQNALDKDYLIASYFTPGSGIVSVIPNRGREYFVTIRADL
jgi:iron complex outermembrane receptor protein